MSKAFEWLAIAILALAVIGVVFVRLSRAADRGAELRRGVPQDIISACTSDALRLCSGAIFTFDKSSIVACMNANHASLSTGCRTAIAKHQR
jgi:hypothetical protein